MRGDRVTSVHRLPDRSFRPGISSPFYRLPFQRTLFLEEDGDVRGESVHPPPIGAPFSATERFIKKTTSVSANIATANSQKQSKYDNADACC